MKEWQKKIYDGKASGKRGRFSVDLLKDTIKDTGGRSCKKHEDPPEGMYKEIDDSGLGEINNNL